MIIKQILFVSTLENVKWIVWRIWILMLGGKGLILNLTFINTIYFVPSLKKWLLSFHLRGKSLPLLQPNQLQQMCLGNKSCNIAVHDEIIYMYASVLHRSIRKNLSKCVCNSAHDIILPSNLSYSHINCTRNYRHYTLLNLKTKYSLMRRDLIK